VLHYDPAVDEALIEVRLTPRSSADVVVGLSDGVLRVRVKAPPVDGRANVALCELLSRTVGLPPSAVVVVSGLTARTKLVRIVGYSRDRVLEILGASGRESQA
jgi:uncharacterized protein